MRIPKRMLQNCVGKGAACPLVARSKIADRSGEKQSHSTTACLETCEENANVVEPRQYICCYVYTWHHPKKMGCSNQNSQRRIRFKLFFALSRTWVAASFKFDPAYFQTSSTVLTKRKRNPGTCSRRDRRYQFVWSNYDGFCKKGAMLCLDSICVPNSHIYLV